MTRPSEEILRAFREGFLARIGFTRQELSFLTGIPITHLRSLSKSGRVPPCKITPRRHLLLVEDLAYLTGDTGAKLEDAFVGEETLSVQRIIQATGISLNTWDRLIVAGELEMIPTPRNATRRCERSVLVDFLRDRRDT